LKIVIDCRFWGTKHTGLGRYTRNLVDNLLTLDKRDEYFLLVREKMTRKLPITNYQLLITNIIPYSLREQLLLPRILKDINPDLIHFPHFNVPVLNSFPFVLTIHDLIKHYSRGLGTTTRDPWIYLLKYWGYKQVFSQAVKRAKKIIVPSNFVKKQLLKHYQMPENKIVVIYEGANSNIKYQISNIKKTNQILKKYKIKKPFLLYVGNIYPHKNLERLILAVKKLNSLNTSLVIVAARDVFFQRLKKTIKRLKAESLVKLTGHLSDRELKTLYSQAEAFVSPSLMEGFGLPGLEAMMSDCPVVCSKIPTFQEIYGRAAIYFNPRDIDNIAEKISTAISFSEKERKELIRKGKEQASQYSWQKCARQTLKIYKTI
jgi:glycosyltransferase involved in cell wall biosynthesis